MTRRHPRHNPTPIEQVLERIDAQPIPDADDLAQMSAFEIERQLADLGVDTDAELSELLGQIDSPPVQPLANLSASDVEQLSIAQVERRLEAEGVDVRAWLSRAEALIRNARLRAPMDEPRMSTARAPSRGLHDGAHRPGLPRGRRWQRRRVPQALAASIVMVAIAGVTLSMLDEPELDVGVPFQAFEGPEPSTAKSEPVAVREKSPKREGTPLAQATKKQSEQQSAFTRDLHTFGQSSAKRRRDAMHDTLVADAPLLSMDESRPPSAKRSPVAPASPSVAAAAASANTGAQHEAKTSAVAKSKAPDIALPAPVAPQKSPQESPQESPRESLVDQRPAPSRVDDAVAHVRSQGQPGAPMPRAAGRLRKEEKAVEAVASTGAARQQRSNAGTENETDDASTTVYVLRRRQTLAMSLAGLSLREADRVALVRVFSDVDVSSGANLRLSMHNQIVQTADLQLPQGRLITAVRDSHGELVLKR